MTDKKRDDESATTQSHVSQTAATTPAMQAQDGTPRHRAPDITVTSQDDEAVKMLQDEYPGAPRWGLQVLHKVGKVEKIQEDHGARILTLEQLRASIPPMRPRAQSLTNMREEDVADSFTVLSADQQNQVVAKGLIRSRKQNYTQTGVIVSTLVALAVAGAGFINAQTDKTRAETARAAAAAAAEVIANSPQKATP